MKILHLFPLLIALIFFSFQSESVPASSHTQIELQKVNTEINNLEEQLVKTRKNALNLELQAQPYMFDNWHEFANDIRMEEENEKKVIIVKEKLKELYKQRETLLNQPAFK